MAYRITRQNDVEFNNGSNNLIGGLITSAGGTQTALELVSPDGTTWYIVVSDLGAVTAQNTKP